MSNWTDNSSIIGHLGGYVDRALNPISWITGGKSTDFTSDLLPKMVNSGLSTVMKPFDKIDQAINPVRKIPIVNRVSDIVANKPGDAAALAAGAVFGGGALLGGAGAGGAGAGAGAGAADGLGAGAADGIGTDVGGDALGPGLGSGFGGVGTDAGAMGWGNAAATAGGDASTASGFGGVGTDPSVSALDGSSIDPALGGDDIDAGGGWNPADPNSTTGAGPSASQKQWGKLLGQMFKQQQQQAQAQLQKQSLLPSMGQSGLLPTTSTYRGGSFVSPN